MFVSDQTFDDITAREVEFHESTIVSIVEEVYAGELCDLSVDEDESYVANGLAIHNCRSGIIPLTGSGANEVGITKHAPTISADEGFGLAPSDDDDDDMKPDPDDYPDELFDAKDIP